MAAQSTETLMQEVIDREAIRSLPLRYCHCVWQKDLDGYVNLFTDSTSACTRELARCTSATSVRVRKSAATHRTATGNAAAPICFSSAESIGTVAPKSTNAAAALASAACAASHSVIESSRSARSSGDSDRRDAGAHAIAATSPDRGHDFVDVGQRVAC